MTEGFFTSLIAHYGYLAVFVVTLVASSGIPIPAGELLLAAAAFAGTSHSLTLTGLILTASLGAVGGGAAGYAIGASAGAAALHRWGPRVGLGAARQRLGQYLFLKYGGKIVFFVRFVAFIGPFGGVLAGANQMPFWRFMLFNVLGGVAWAAAAVLAGYGFGSFLHAAGPAMGIVTAVAILAALVALGYYLRGHEAQLQREADALLLETAAASPSA